MRALRATNEVNMDQRAIAASLDLDFDALLDFVESTPLAMRRLGVRSRLVAHARFG